MADSMRYALAKWVMRNRTLAALFFFLVTVFFAIGLKGVQLKTVFSDLLPADDPFVQVYADHPNFGNPLTMMVMVRRKSGDIYNSDTLQKVWDLTRDIDLTPGVDHDQVVSITTEKARYAEATPYGIDSRPIMGDRVPQTEEELEELQRRIEQSPGVRRFMISEDESATLINATFIERLLDYGVAFDHVQGLVEAARDEDHDVYLAGQPALTGWVYYYEGQIFAIFAVTLALLLIALAIYMRNLVGILTPVVTSSAAAIWGFGLVGWLESPIEPLLIVVPLLLVARSFSHSVQFIERFYEIYAEIKDRRQAAEITMSVMLAPSVLGILTDSIGILLIALAPIPAMERFALFAGFWALCLVPTGVFMISLLLSALPEPGNVERIVGSDNESGLHLLIRKILVGVSVIIHGRMAWATVIIVLIGSAVAVYNAAQIKIGNPVEGSSLLWPDDEYNQAVRQINGYFPGVNTLEVILEAKDTNNPNRVARQIQTVNTAAQLQVIMESGENPPRATLSFNDYLMEANRLIQGGNPKWFPIDPTDKHANGAATALLAGSSPKAYSHIVDFVLQNSTISLWYPDNKQETVDLALAAAKQAVAQVGENHPEFRVRLGSGTIALQQSMNSVVERYHYVILGLLNLAILVMCSVAYKSIYAGIVLLVPVNLANAILTAAMHRIGIGLDINSMMVAVIGVGVGIDYGIYLLSRICEEYQNQEGDWKRAISEALTTTGKAIFFTASIMLVAILPWYFLSGLKFTADMGLLLACIMLINMVLALLVLPMLVWWVKPGFVKRKDLLVSESVDLTKVRLPDGAMAVTA